MPKYHYKFTGNLKEDTRMIKEFTKCCVDEMLQEQELKWIRLSDFDIKDYSEDKKYWYQRTVGNTAVVSKEKPSDTIPFSISKMYIGEL